MYFIYCRKPSKRAPFQAKFPSGLQDLSIFYLPLNQGTQVCSKLLEWERLALL